MGNAPAVINRPRKKKRRKLSNGKKLLISIAVVIVVIPAAVVAINTQMQIQDINSEKAKLEGELEAEKQQEALYRSKIGFTETDEYIERAAREKLGWVKEDERKFVFEGDSTASPEASENIEPSPTPDE